MLFDNLINIYMNTLFSVVCSIRYGLLKILIKFCPFSGKKMEKELPNTLFWFAVIILLKRNLKHDIN